MVKFFNTVGKAADKILLKRTQPKKIASGRIIVESNGSVRANYDNADVRNDLLNEMRKFVDFPVGKK